MKRLSITATPLDGVLRVDRKIGRDMRGSFARLFCAEELAAAGWIGPIAQVNHSVTARRASVRGMHFQYAPHAEAKLVTCIRGTVFDVAVDLRKGSPTYLQWHGETLIGAEGGAMLIPPGFAHGFQSRSDDVELIYCHSRPYASSAEGGIHPFDPAISIDWPEPVSEISDRDRSHPSLTDDFQGVIL